MTKNVAEFLRTIPSVNKCLESQGASDLKARFGVNVTTLVIREVIAEMRGQLQSRSRNAAVSIDEILEASETRLVRLAHPEGRRVINATGIMIHTGLGRSPLCKEAIDAISNMSSFSLLELDLESGERGRRDERVEWIMQKLTGAEAASVVNNNAAATLIILKALASGKEVIISRGQLIEIGGSFRMPDIMKESGAILKEVGTTNRTHLSDYENAIGPNTGAIIHVHPSNYRIRGFASEPSIAELATLGKEKGVPVIDDLGSGALVKLDQFNISEEELVSESVSAGADIVCFSGDKLISGPQAGIIVGKKSFVEKVRRDPFYRMFRVDKLCLAALEATLLHFLDGAGGLGSLPLYQLLNKSPEHLRSDAEKIKATFDRSEFFTASVVEDASFVGGGSSPDKSIQSYAVKVTAKFGKASITDLAHSLRTGIPAVVGRVQDSALYLNVRTLLAGDLNSLIEVIGRYVSLPTETPKVVTPKITEP